MSSRTFNLTESIDLSTAERVDVENAIIYGVRISGRISKNGRRYEEAAENDAIRLYQDCSVYTNHPSKNERGNDRKVQEKVGWFENPHKRPDGPYGDLHLWKRHDFTPILLEAAQRKSNQFAMSHNISGRSRFDKDGTEVIESIHTVHSVDIVGGEMAATTNGLFESRSMPTPTRTTKTVLVEALKTRPKLRKWVEDYSGDSMGMNDDADAPVPGGAGPMPDDKPEHGAETFQAILDIVTGALEGVDESVYNPKYLKDLKKIKSVAEACLGKTGDGDDGTSDPADDEPTEESRKKTADAARITESLQRKDAVRTICDGLGFIPNAVQLKALLPLEDGEIKTMVESFQGGQGKGGQAPRSQSPGKSDTAPAAGRVTESRNTDPIKHRESIVNELRTGVASY